MSDLPPPEAGPTLQPPPPPPSPQFVYPFGPTTPYPAGLAEQFSGAFLYQWLPPEYQAISPAGSVVAAGEAAAPTQGVREQQLSAAAAEAKATEERQAAEANRIAREVEEAEGERRRYAQAYARASEDEQQSRSLVTLVLVVAGALVALRFL